MLLFVDRSTSGSVKLLGRVSFFLSLFAFLASAMIWRVNAQNDLVVYADASLQNGWQDWSWGSAREYASSTVTPHSGSSCLAVTITGSWGAVSLWHNDIDTSSYTNLIFWIHGGAAGGQRLRIYAELGSTAQPAVDLPVLTANTWQQISLSMAALGVANQPNFRRFSIQDTGSSSGKTFYLDDIVLKGSAAPPVTNSAVAITVDAQANRHPISPLIYGTAFASSSELSDLNAPVNRSGGNAETRYNWQLNAHNRGGDWYFESIADSPATPGADADNFVTSSRAGGAEPMLTIPMLGWVPKLGPNRGKLASYSIAKYGPQTGNDASWMPDAGNGVGTNAASRTSWLITTNNPDDANLPTNSVFQRAFVEHLIGRWGKSTNGGVRYYFMDNEHSIWHSTHRDVHPTGATMEEIRDKILDYGSAVKSVDPDAIVLGPEEWGWSGYLYSGYDQWYGSRNGWGNLPDRAGHGGMDYCPWLLKELYQRATNTNQRVLDYFTLHFYPQSGEFTDDVSSTMQLLRNRSTRVFWDTNYVDASWINSVVKLIPRMREWVSKYYPGLKTGITEYNWGAEAHINGATAQADILGIFGRENLDLATRWTTPASGTPTYKAMKLYRNYDGSKSTFGDVSVRAVAPNPDAVAVFGAVRTTDGAMTIMAINKQISAAAKAGITLSNFTAAGTAQVWRLTSANAITRLNDISLTGRSFTNELPAQSITLFVVPRQTSLTQRPLIHSSSYVSGAFSLAFQSEKGPEYVVEYTENLSGGVWQVLTNVTGTGGAITVKDPAATTTSRFYRIRGQ
jgi:hypothetical protein